MRATGLLADLRRALLPVAFVLPAASALAGELVLSDAQLDSVTAGVEVSVYVLQEGYDATGTTGTGVELVLNGEGDKVDAKVTTKTKVRTIETKGGTLTISRTRAKGVITGEETSGDIGVWAEGDVGFETTSVRTRTNRKGSKTVVKGRATAITFTPHPPTS